MEAPYTMPKIGDQAPNFDALTTTGPLLFSEYNSGSWVILFSHPADFTPVCTTELSGFALEEEAFFRRHNTKLLGLSIDSIHSHIAWVQNVRQTSGIYFRFPIIADLDMKVARLYGMLQPGESETAAVRAVFIIDPEGLIRLIMYYPLNVGRNMEEIKRVLLALQTAATHDVALPLNWQPGEPVIVPPPKTLEALDQRLESGYEMQDFYLARTQIDRQPVQLEEEQPADLS
jgi:peroxiredoxin 2/4